MRSHKQFSAFFDSEQAGGMFLVLFTVVAMSIANAPFGDAFLQCLHSRLLWLSLEHWVNDGLMTVFFFLIGLELEREIYVGELSEPRNAILPIFAAIGGMLVPAAIHYAVCRGSLTIRGAGIPMATDIAFSLGMLALVSNRVPIALKVFLTALAITDDLGAVLVIAIFYTKSISLFYLAAAMTVFIGLCILNRLRVDAIWIYLVGGIAMWLCMLQSGVHATLTGVLLAFALPFREGDELSPSYHCQHWLHKPVAFVILPIFALVNTSIPIGPDWLAGLTQPNSIGILLGLVVGKPLGIMLFCVIAIQLGLCTLPPETTFSHLMGAALLAGIGFTMSIFVSILAFDDASLINNSQVMVLIASVLAAALGLLWMIIRVPKRKDADFGEAN